jgi:hypothetical protein
MAGSTCVPTGVPPHRPFLNITRYQAMKCNRKIIAWRYT